MSAERRESQRFECTRAGVIQKGQRRIAFLLVGLSIGMLLVAIAVWISGRIFPGLLALGVAIVTFTAWRMSCELNLQWLSIDGDLLTLRAVHQQIQLPLEELSPRRLSPSEIEHLERLASVGGIVAGSGGFDSHILGEFDLYATDLTNSILIESSDIRLIVTPDRPEEFLAALKR